MKKRILLLLLTLSLLLTMSCNQSETPTTETDDEVTTTDGAETNNDAEPTRTAFIYVENLEEYYEKISTAKLELLNAEGGYSQAFVHYDALKECGQFGKFLLSEYETFTAYSYRFNDSSDGRTDYVSIAISSYKEYNEKLYSNFRTSSLDFDKHKDQVIDNISSNDLFSIENQLENPEGLEPIMTPKPWDYYYYLQPNIEYEYDRESKRLKEIVAVFDGILKITITIDPTQDYQDNPFIAPFANKETALDAFEELKEIVLNPPATE